MVLLHCLSGAMSPWPKGLFVVEMDNPQGYKCEAGIICFAPGQKDSKLGQMGQC